MSKKKKQFSEILDLMKAQFGDAAKAFWVYDGDLCPGCMVNKVDLMEYEGKEALSLNFFMYRERGALIAYVLCGNCAMDVLATPPGTVTTPRHKSIETNLIDAYLRHLRSFS